MLCHTASPNTLRMLTPDQLYSSPTINQQTVCHSPIPTFQQMLTPKKQKLQHINTTTYQSISPPQTTFTMLTTPDKIHSPTMTNQTTLLIANTSPQQQQQQHNTPCQTYAPCQNYTKRRILFTEDPPCQTPTSAHSSPIKPLKAIQNETRSPEYQSTCMYPTTNTRATAQSNIPLGEINSNNQKILKFITKYNQLSNVKENVSVKKVAKRKPTIRKQLIHSRKNDGERVRARNESNALKILRSNLPPLRVKNDNTPVYAKNKCDVLNGAITYIKELQRLLKESDSIVI